MRRRNSGTFKDTPAVPEAYDTLDSRDIIQSPLAAPAAAAVKPKPSTTTTSIANATNTNINPSSKPRIPPKDGFLSWFERQDARQIKKLEYPTDKLKSRATTGRRKWREIIYVSVVGLVSIGLSGMTFGLHQLVETAANFGLSQPKPKTIILPPNTKIPRELLTSVQRHASPSDVPLLIEWPPKSQDETPLLEEQQDFHYPNETLDNATTSSIRNVEDFYYPAEMDDEVYHDKEYKDFGDVDIRFVTEEGQSRKIYREVWEREGRARPLNTPRDDDVEAYWAFDDDWLRNPYVQFDDDKIQDERRCRRVNWTRKSFPTGNIIHEIDLVTNVPEFVGEGAYREVFIVEYFYLDKMDLIVLKEIRFELDMQYDDYEYVRVDALITERMTANKQIVSMHGFTGFSMITEAFTDGDIENDLVGVDRSEDFLPLEEPELVTKNNFTGSQKLKLALSMVEPVAALHNFKDGVIVHDDIQLSQYLWTDETKSAVKLNDFNRAEVMFWDEQNQEYCTYVNGRGHGDWRAPEEYRDEPLNEKIDVWSLCNNFFSLLTGYYPFPNLESSTEIKKKIAANETPEVDPRFRKRSFAENKLVDIIGRCYVPDVKERADINELLELLRDAIKQDTIQRVVMGDTKQQQVPDGSDSQEESTSEDSHDQGNNPSEDGRGEVEGEEYDDDHSASESDESGD